MTYEEFLEKLKNYRGKFHITEMGTIRLTDEEMEKITCKGYDTICCPTLVVVNEGRDRNWITTDWIFEANERWPKEIMRVADAMRDQDPQTRHDVLAALDLKDVQTP